MTCFTPEHDSTSTYQYELASNYGATYSSNNCQLLGRCYRLVAVVIELISTLVRVCQSLSFVCLHVCMHDSLSHEGHVTAFAHHMRGMAQ